MATTSADAAGIPVINPRTGEQLYAVQEYSDEEVAAIYERARAAAAKLRAMSVQQRIDESIKLRDYILANRDSIVDQLISETGKCRMDAYMTEIFPALDMIEHYRKTAVKTLADQRVKTPIVLLGKKSRVYYEPLGVSLIISPWNYPFHLAFVPFITSFIAGNATVMKPSTQTPLKGLYEAMIEKSGFMKDALQLVYGSRKTGYKLIEGKPDKIFFTGSVGGGRAVMRQAAEHLIPVELELGGKDPMIVFDDVDLERAVNGALWGGYLNSGQTCTSVERVVVQDTIAERFVETMKQKLDNLVTLDTLEGPDDGALGMGCMTAEFQIKEIEEQLAEAKEKGAAIVCGGARKPGTHMLPPTIVKDVDPSMRIVSDETFGPVIVVQTFKTEAEAIQVANDSCFGLNSSVWSKDLTRADRVARALVTGSCSINNVLGTQASSALPFGGVKQSGFGRYHGTWGLYGFSNIKAVLIDKSSNKIELNWYPYSKEKLDLFNKLLEALFGGSPLGVLKAGLVALKLEMLCKRKRL